MPIDRLEGLDRAYFRFELRSWSAEAGLRIPMPAVGHFRISICPWCGEPGQIDPGKYAEHVLAEHKEDLKPYKRRKDFAQKVFESNREKEDKERETRFFGRCLCGKRECLEHLDGEFP